MLSLCCVCTGHPNIIKTYRGSSKHMLGVSKHIRCPNIQGAFLHAFLSCEAGFATSNTFNSPNLGNYSPLELTFGRKPKLLLNTETYPDIRVSTNFKEYYDLLNKRIKYLQDILFNFKSRRLAMINQNKFPI